jgi:hypothetical protein
VRALNDPPSRNVESYFPRYYLPRPPLRLDFPTPALLPWSCLALFSQETDPVAWLMPPTTTPRGDHDLACRRERPRLRRIRAYHLLEVLPRCRAAMSSGVSAGEEPVEGPCDPGRRRLRGAGVGR